MKQQLKVLCILFFATLGLLSCGNNEEDPRVEKVEIKVQPEEPIVYDFDYKYEDNLGDTITLSKNYFQADVRIKNDNPDFGLVIVGFKIEATSSSTNGGVKTDEISIGPVNSSYLLSIGTNSSDNITLNIGGLNPDAQGLSYSIKLVAKGYFSSPSDPTEQLDRFTQEFFFNAN